VDRTLFVELFPTLLNAIVLKDSKEIQVLWKAAFDNTLIALPQKLVESVKSASVDCVFSLALTRRTAPEVNGVNLMSALKFATPTPTAKPERFVWKELVNLDADLILIVKLQRSVFLTSVDVDLDLSLDQLDAEMRSVQESLTLNHLG